MRKDMPGKGQDESGWSGSLQRVKAVDMLLCVLDQVRKSQCSTQESLMRNRCWAKLIFLKSDVINQ